MAYIVTQNVDYLAWTKVEPHWFFHEKVFASADSPSRNYDRAEISNMGIMHLWSTRNPDVKHHYIASGETLQNLRNNGLTDIDMVQRCLENAHISRIDIAITSQRDDNKPHGFNPHHLAWAVRDGRLKSRMKPAKDIVSDMKTETKYIGNRKTRKRLFRAYDKGLDLNLEAHKLIRYELETRQGTKTIARAVVRGVPFNALIKRYVDFPDVAVWQEIMSTEIAQIKQETPSNTPLDKMIDKSNSRWHWLMHSVIPVIDKALAHDEKLGIPRTENEQFTKFVRYVMQNLDKT